MESKMIPEVGESSSNSSFPSNSNGDKTVIVRVKRKADHSPLEAFWLEINERPVKRPLIDFQKLSISSTPTQEELKIKRVLVQHVDTFDSSKDSIQFLQSFVQPTSDGDSKFRASTKERRRTLQKENIHDQLLSKAKQEQEEIAKNARFEQLWKRRARDKEASQDEALDEVCRVYDVLRVDETSSKVKKEEISVEDQEMLSKFLPLLKEFVPGAAEDIESDINSSASRQDSADEYVYDVYAVKENFDETETSYPFPLVQVDDDEQFFDGLDDSDYETDDSNAENRPCNDYPDEESSESEEEKSSKSGSESEEEKSEDDDNLSTKSKDSTRHERSEDQLYEDDMDEMDGRHNPAYSDDGGDDEDWRWGYR